MPIEPLVKPRSVAIVGATDRGGPGRAVMESLGAIGFTGPIYPVNPKYKTVLNIACYPSLMELPEAPDIVVFSIRNPLIPEQMRLAVKRGARAAVIYDSGFAETGADGARLQEEIAGLAREAGMPVCGPNCMGILNPPARVTTYKQNIMDPPAIVGNVGIVSQSGSVCIALLSDLRRFGVSLSVSAGNEAVTRTVDYLEYLIDDPNTKAIATFTETVREPERYVAALDRAADAGKPVVVIKVGRSERTQRAITSHTGGLAGSSRVFSELLRAHRAIEVSDLDEMTEVLAVCQGRRWPRGRGISVITGSGGLSELIQDNATALGLDLPPLSPAERAEAERVIGRISGDGNPFDAWGNGDYATNLPHAMAVVDASERIDAICYCSDTSNDPVIGHPGRVLENVAMLTAAAQKSAKPYYLLSTRSGVMNRKQVDAMREAGLVVIGGTRQGLAALDRMGRWAAASKALRKPGAKPQLTLADHEFAGRRTINEFDAKRLLAAYGIPVARELRVITASEAAQAAEKLGYPVVLKVVSDAIAHKTELGLVAVNLKNADELAAAFTRLNKAVASLDPYPADVAYLVQEFVADGVEVFAGVSRDPDFGLTLAFGLGGIAIEALKDFSLRMLPLRDGDAEAMIAETRGAALLGPLRGREAADTQGLAECLYALGEFAWGNAARIAEIDLNPIKVLPGRGGCVVVDALIVTRPDSSA
ncbi:MAG TPA: acetate--CoA ligase family protein [Xanthobacteraceae bacterium]|nr:acetate--CoA ligase family protein [Xanthobacteraceae bacterium]